MDVITFEVDGELCVHTPCAANGHTVESQLANPDFLATTEGAELVPSKKADLPEYTYRYAWKLENGKVVICPIKKKKVDADIETVWIDSEILPLQDKIEGMEDTGTKATKLRTYRAALKQYKTDLYMPNITRPKL